MSNWRATFSNAGMYLALSMLTIATLAFILVQASFRTWTVGRFFAGKASFFVDGFLVVGALSLLTLFASLFGNGKRRLIGLVASLTTIIAVLLIFRLNP